MLSDDGWLWTERTQDPTDRQTQVMLKLALFPSSRSFLHSDTCARTSGTNWLPDVLVKHPLSAKLSTTKYILTPLFYFTYLRGLLFSSGPGSAVNCDPEHHGHADSGAACGPKVRLRQPRSRHVQYVYRVQCHGHVNMLNLHRDAIVDTLPTVDEALS